MVQLPYYTMMVLVMMISSVEVTKDFKRHLSFSQVVVRPGEILTDVSTMELESFDRLHLGPSDVNGEAYSFFLLLLGSIVIYMLICDV